MLKSAFRWSIAYVPATAFKGLKLTLQGSAMAVLDLAECLRVVSVCTLMLLKSLLQFAVRGPDCCGWHLHCCYGCGAKPSADSGDCHYCHHYHIFNSEDQRARKVRRSDDCLPQALPKHVYTNYLPLPQWKVHIYCAAHESLTGMAKSQTLLLNT